MLVRETHRERDTHPSTPTHTPQTYTNTHVLVYPHTATPTHTPTLSHTHTHEQGAHRYFERDPASKKHPLYRVYYQVTNKALRDDHPRIREVHCMALCMCGWVCVCVVILPIRLCAEFLTESQGQWSRYNTRDMFPLPPPPTHTYRVTRKFLDRLF